MAVVKKISELTPKGSALSNTDLLVVGVDNGTDYDLKSVTGAQLMSGSVVQTITDGDTTRSPSSNVVFDALALKVDKVVGKGLSTEDYTTAEKSKLAGLSGTNTGDQTLQQVTAKGNVTTNNIIIEDNLWKTSLYPQSIQVSSLDLSRYSVLDADGKIQLKTNAIATGLLKATNITAETTLEFPIKTAGSYTIATTSDLTSKVDGNTAITGATKTKITYDNKGLVTSGADATTADITDSLNKRYVSDANLTTIGNTSGTNTGDQDLSGLMVKSNNLSDLTNTTTARSNLGLGSLATQSGTFSGTSSGTNTGDQDLSTYQPYTTATTGSVISFVVPQVYNSVASPSSSNITDSLTSAKIGIVQKIYHNHTVAPTFPAGWVKMGTATYTTSTLNVIFAEWVSSTRVEYWITKPS